MIFKNILFSKLVKINMNFINLKNIIKFRVELYYLNLIIYTIIVISIFTFYVTNTHLCFIFFYYNYESFHMKISVYWINN